MIVRVADVVCDKVPLVPLIVRGYEPTGVAELVATFSVDGPNPGTVGTVNVAVVLAGKPLTPKLIAPENGPVAVAKMPKAKLLPGGSATGVLVTAMLKLGVTEVNCEAVKACV